MGFGGISAWQLLIVLGIALCIFGTSRLKTLGTDLGGALKGFRKAMEHEEDSPAASRHGAAPLPRLAEEKADDVGTVRLKTEKQG